MRSEQEFLQKLNEVQGILWKICHLYCPEAVDKQDLFQEILVQLWRAYPKFRGEAKFSTWVYRIGLNVAISFLRKEKRKPSLVDLPKEVYEMAAPEVDEEKEERKKLLYWAIRQLKTIEKAIVLLYLEEKSYEEIAQIVGITQNNLRVRISRIKEKLRKLMLQPIDS
ncbi:MAG: RNA polymerase sigma factor [Thermonemataceae bacterium]